MIDYGMKKRMLGVGVITLLILFVFLITYESKDTRVNPAYKRSSMMNLQLTHKKDNKIRWILSASRADMPVSERKIFLKGVKLRIINDPEMILASGSGEYNIEKGLMTLSQSVKIDTEDGHFITDTLKWDTKNNRIFTDDPVILKGEHLEIRGNGLRADITSGKVRISKNVKAIYYF
jgi:LPS export ABC transporter protein LptC